MSANGIDPKAFLLLPPQRLRDKNFIFACYHLLNNCILYFFPHGRRIYRTVGMRKEIFYRTNGSSTSSTLPFERDGAWSFDLAQGIRNETMEYDVEAYYYFKNSQQQLIGEWQMRCHSSAEAYAFTENVPESSNRWQENFQHIVDFDGMESRDVTETIPAEIHEKAEFYRTWGNNRYRAVDYSATSASGGLFNHEAKLTKDNFPPLNYKYYDPPD